MSSISSIFGDGISYAGGGVLQALSNLSVNALGTVVNAAESAIGPWRPPKWAQPPVTSITVPGTSPTNINTNSGLSQIADTSPLGVGAIPNPNNDSQLSDAENNGVFTMKVNAAAQTQGTPAQVFIFDGILRLEHEQRSTPTEFPVQTGANLSDHIYIKPAKLVMEIFMSDVMQSYTIGQFTNGTTRSQSAYFVLKTLLFNRTPVTITTKLDTYTFMCLVNMHVPDNFQTINSLKATCTFQQLFTAQIASSNVSSRVGDTDSTQLGSVPTLPVPGIVTDNYFVPPPIPAQSLVPYSGTYSSNPIDDATFGGS